MVIVRIFSALYGNIMPFIKFMGYQEKFENVQTRFTNGRVVLIFIIISSFSASNICIRLMNIFLLSFVIASIGRRLAFLLVAASWGTSRNYIKKTQL